MARRYIRNSLNKTATLSGDNGRWELSAGKYVKNTTMTADTGIEIKDGADNVSLAIKGKIVMAGSDGHAGLAILGDNAKVGLAKTAVIQSSGYGILAGIAADNNVPDFERVSLSILGRVSAVNDALSINADEANIRIGATGRVVSSNQSGIMVENGHIGGLVTITNAGHIEGAASQSAILTGDATLRLVNTGTIKGDVWGGNGADWFDLRKGSIDGLVYGQYGDDTYLVADRFDANGMLVQSAQAMVETIIELQSAGIDVLRARGSVDLSVGSKMRDIDMIVLAGTGDYNVNADGGGGAHQTIYGNSGKNEILGGAGNDTLIGLDGNDTLFGEGDYDYLDGGAGNDTLQGGAFHDVLFGGAGNDRLVADDGADELTGEADADVFAFTDAFNGATVHDYVDGTDKIDLSALDFGADEGNAAASFAKLTLTNAVVLNTVIESTITYNGETLHLTGIDKAVLDVSDFIF